MYVVTAPSPGPHAAPAADETATAAGAHAAAPDAALAANGGAAVSAGGAGANPADGEPAPAGSDFGDVLQREQRGGAPAGSGAATPAQGRAARHHDARHDDAGSPAAGSAPAVPLLVAVTTSPTPPLGSLALRPRGEGVEAADHAKTGDEQGAAAGRLGLGQERGYAAFGTGTAWSPERTVTLSTSMQSQPQTPAVTADALAAAETLVRQAAGMAPDGAAGAPQPGGQLHEGSTPVKGHLSLVPSEDHLNVAPAAATLLGAAPSVPAHAVEAKVTPPQAPTTAVAASDAPAQGRAAGVVPTGEQLGAAIAAVANLAMPAGTTIPAGAATGAAPRLTRDRASGSTQIQEHGAASAPGAAIGSDAQQYGASAPTVQPHGAQAVSSLPQVTLPHGLVQATHGAAGEATARTDSATAGVQHNDVAPHSVAAPRPDGRAAAGRDQGQQGAPIAATPAGLTSAALPMSGTVAPADRGVSAAPGERSTPAPAQHSASNVGRHDGTPAPQGVPMGSTAALPATLPGVAPATSVPSVLGGRLPAAGVRASGVETALHRAPANANGSGADSSMMPLRPHTVAPAAGGSAAFGLPQALTAATGTAPAHHATPKGTTATSGVLAPVAEGIFVRLGSLRTTPSSSSFHVVLQPQALGTVSVHVERGQDGLQVTLIPQQSATRELLDRHMHELVSALGTADGVAPRVSVVAPGAASSGSFSGADQGMMGSGAFSTDSGGQQPFQGQGAQGEPSSWDDTARPPVTPAPVRAPAPSRAPLSSQWSGNTSRVDFQA